MYYFPKKILHSHWNLVAGRVVLLYVLVWLNMLGFGPQICIVGLLALMISLSEAHSLTVRVKFGKFIGGKVNWLCLACMKLIRESYGTRVFSLCLISMKLLSRRRL